MPNLADFEDAPSISPTLAANETVKKLRADGRHIYHMGFGEAPFPAPDRMMAALKKHADKKQYLPVKGLSELREAILHHQSKLTNIDEEDFDIIIGPGSKLIIYALQMAIKGDILLPDPSWVSYAPQAQLINSNVIPVKTELGDQGFILNGETLEQTITKAKASNLNPTKLLINFPSNPTGLTISNETLNDIAAICKKHKITLISDEIYGRLSFDHVYRSAAKTYPEGTIVTSGLSKHLSLGGWRLGFAMIPKSMKNIINQCEFIASETWSCVAAPIQFASLEAYAGHEDIETFIDQTTNIHAAVNTHIAAKLNELGINCPRPQGAFYTWPDFTNKLNRKFKTSEDLSNALLQEAGIVTLPGTAFGAAPERLCLRLSGCDYQGSKALEHYNQHQLRNIPIDVENFAPNIKMALSEFDKFIKNHSQ